MKPKHFFALLFSLFIIMAGYSQQSNALRVYYGVVDSKFLSTKDFNGSASYDNENSYEFGVRYLRKFSANFSLETGINVLSSKVRIKPAFTGTPVNSRYENLKLISIPFYANYSFGNYFYVNGGPLLDFANTLNVLYSQSGIGYGVGFGGKYNFNRFLIYLNPNFKRHSVIPFKKETNHKKLTEFGIQFGVG